MATGIQAPYDVHTGYIQEIERLNNSVNGNPRYNVLFVWHPFEPGDWYTTTSDASCSYDIDNLYNSQDRVTLELTRAGFIRYARRVK